MRYALLIYFDEGATALAEQAGRWFDGAGPGDALLDSVATATTVRVRGDEVLLTDGPFAETRDQLGGIHIVEAADLDAALAAAVRLPAARFGAVEVRPLRAVSNS